MNLGPLKPVRRRLESKSPRRERIEAMLLVAYVAAAGTALICIRFGSEEVAVFAAIATATGAVLGYSLGQRVAYLFAWF